MKLLVILFIIKLIAQINIFKYVGQKHAESAVKTVRILDKLNDVMQKFPHCSYYTLMTFCDDVICNITMLLILISTLSVISHLTW